MKAVEIEGIIGKTSMRKNEKKGCDMLNIQIMSTKGKTYQVQVLHSNRDVLALPFGQKVSLRFQEIAYSMSDFNTGSLGCQDVSIIGKA